jgi:glycerophosphoryl diester phosphodiesterase
MAEGCDGFEFDVRYTRDRRAVLAHDPKLGGKEVATTDYAGLERRRGPKVPCLQDVLTRFGGTAFLNIELKTPGTEEEVGKAIQANPPRRGYLVSSFLPGILRTLREIDYAMPLGYICSEMKEAYLWSELPVSVFLPNASLVSPMMINNVHARDRRLIVWTVNDVQTMMRFSGWGVDGLISDNPRLMVQTFSETVVPCRFVTETA